MLGARTVSQTPVGVPADGSVAAAPARLIQEETHRSGCPFDDMAGARERERRG